ncbi:hypothetical protein [Snodgrassella communis]|uniref:Uncharacterized protein n=1 Tax=Snodgrassella alvi TaxID=1196083 RepID=A0A2N9XTL8_9NEIS|nr:hypothetical protein [Snodgrassella communis]PIT52581.1 hypothetical protein BHC48_02115 [Snodgrassella communis]
MDKLESNLRVIKNTLGVFGIIGNVIGTIIVIFYCCTIRFFPAGLSVGDVLFCLCIFAIFGILYIVFIGVLHLASKLFLILFEKQIYKILIKKKINPVTFSKDRLFILCLSVIANILILFIAYRIWIQSSSLQTSLVFGFTVYMAIFCVGCMNVFISQWEELKLKNESEPSEENDRRLYFYIRNIKISSKFLFRVGMFITPLIVVSGIYVGLTNITLSLIGVRQSDVTIYVDKNYQHLFYNSENKDYFDKINCSSACQLEHVNILMTNIGTKTKFQIPAKSIHNTTDSPIEFEVPNEAIKGIRNK